MNSILEKLGEIPIKNLSRLASLGTFDFELLNDEVLENETVNLVKAISYKIDEVIDVIIWVNFKYTQDDYVNEEIPKISNVYYFLPDIRKLYETDQFYVDDNREPWAIIKETRQMKIDENTYYSIEKEDLEVYKKHIEPELWPYFLTIANYSGLQIEILKDFLVNLKKENPNFLKALKRHAELLEYIEEENPFYNPFEDVDLFSAFPEAKRKMLELDEIGQPVIKMNATKKLDSEYSEWVLLDQLYDEKSKVLIKKRNIY